MAKRVAVVLAGCGVFDGSEIHEASAVLVHLSRNGASVSSSCFKCAHAHTQNQRQIAPNATRQNNTGKIEGK